MDGQHTLTVQPSYYSDRPSNLTPLSQLQGWSLAGGRPSIVGWSLVDESSRLIGKIDDLLVDTRSNQVVFAEVTHGGIFGIGGKKILVPMDRIGVGEGRQVAVFNGTEDEIRNAPEYKPDTRDFDPFYGYWSGQEKEQPERKEAEQRPGTEAAQQAPGPVERASESEVTRREEEAEPGLEREITRETIREYRK